MNRYSRRSFLQSAGTALAGLPALSAARAAAGEDARPNILVILVDDLGYGDLGGFGAADLRTPNIDRIFTEGMRFTNGYANCPVCSPTRAALLSGRYQEMVGVPGVIRTHPNNSWGHLTRESVLMSEMLKSAGYKTALVGKWHLGLESPNTPNERGFEHFHGFLGDMMDDYYNHRRHGINYMRLNGEEIDPAGHATDLFSGWACDYLRQADREKPFFLYLAYNAPHTPIQPPRRWVEAYKRRNPFMDEARAKLAALIEHMDDGIGRVLDTLDQTGLADNTLVIFASDNGGQLNVGANNGPYRDGKGTLYEGGIRVPMGARWPGAIRPGSETGRIALSMDIMPTALEAAKVPVRHEIDGVSFMNVLRGEEAEEPVRDLFFGRMEGGAFQGGRVEAIRRGPWKLLRPMPGEPYELYNLDEDPFETRDRSAQNPDTAAELRKALEAQLRIYEQIPWEPPGR